MPVQVKNPIPTSSDNAAASAQPNVSPSEPKENGRFAKGNRGGPGNPYNRQMAAYRKMIHSAVTEDDYRAITCAMIDRARNGDVAAAKLIFQYTAGKPHAGVDPDRVDVDEWKLCEESTVSAEASRDVLLDGMPVSLAMDLAGVMEGVKVEQMKKQFVVEQARAAEDAAIAAAEEEETRRGMEETIRRGREERAAEARAGRQPMSEEEKMREMRWRVMDEIVDAPWAGEPPMTNGHIPDPSEMRIGGERPMTNGDNGGTGDRSPRTKRDSA